jgi:hypothetical protein
MLTSSPDGHPWVITFICKHILSSSSVTQIPALSHYNLLSVTLQTHTFCLHLLNFYHHVQCHQGNLSPLLESCLDHSSPIILCGDFNTHFDTWGPGGKWTSPWAPTLETWLDNEGFVSTVPDGAILQRSSASNPSLIDFIFINEAFLEILSFPFSCSVSFDMSMGSDHAGLLLPIPFSPAPQALFHPPGWKVNPDLKEEWCVRFGTFPLPTITDKASLTLGARLLIMRISEVSDSLFSRKPPPTAHDLPWWS